MEIECAICYEEIEDEQIVRCNQAPDKHTWCLSCHEKWESGTCPICRDGTIQTASTSRFGMPWTPEERPIRNPIPGYRTEEPVSFCNQLGENIYTRIESLMNEMNQLDNVDRMNTILKSDIGNRIKVVFNDQTGQIYETRFRVSLDTICYNRNAATTVENVEQNIEEKEKQKKIWQMYMRKIKQRKIKQRKLKQRKLRGQGLLETCC